MSIARKEGGAWTHSLIGSTSNRSLLMKLMSKLSIWFSSHLVLSLAVGLFSLTGASVQAQNQTVSGHLQVTGDTSLSGALNVTGVAELNSNVTNFGTNGANAATPGLVLTYTDTASGTISTISLATSGTSAIWQWERNSGNGLIPQMTLTGTNSIILWNPTVSNSVGIVLNPAGDSTFSGSITATGTNSRLPNQQITTDTASVLTKGYADDTYLTMNQAASTYIPVGTTVLSVGSGTSATGSYSAAFGYDTIAAGYAQVVLGRYNQVQGNPTSLSSDDNLFVIGNGTSDSNRSNALEIKQNGDATINGALSVSGKVILGSSIKVMGSTTFASKVIALDTIRVTPKGDLSMGEFNVGEPTVAQSLVTNYANVLANQSATISSAQKQNLINFLEAIDSTIGLDNVVECWTFLGGQNVGNGSTAYGLLGKRNAVLANNPDWTSEGIRFNGVNQYGTLIPDGFNADIREFGIFAVFQTEDNSYVQDIFGSGEINTADGIGIRVAGAVWADTVYPGYLFPAVRSNGTVTRCFSWAWDANVARSISNNVWYGASLYTKTNRIYFQVNGTANTDYEWNQWNTFDQHYYYGNRLLLGADCHTRPYFLKGKVAIALVVKSNAVTPFEGIYNIYKSTIGQGLGLP